MMDDTKFYYSKLFKSYLEGSISDNDKIILDNWLADPENLAFFNQLTDSSSWPSELQKILKKDQEPVWQRINERINPSARSTFVNKYRSRLLIAASVVGFLSLSLWWMNREKGISSAQGNTAIVLNNDVQPGNDQAILTLGDGSVILLDSAHSGLISRQGNAGVYKNADGQLIYNALNSDSSAIVYNTLSTPRGGQHKLVLPDGSKVWLNAESSIRFPASFSGKDRTVFITGEVYFEVQKSFNNSERLQLKPFNVRVAPIDSKSKELAIEVLGTEFNVKAYQNEACIYTTLLGGKIKLHSADKALELKPGQQVLAFSNGNISINPGADTLQATAWKNGNFQFDQADLPTILRQLERWFDVTVDYKYHTERKFTLNIEMKKPLSKILQMLERTESVHFTIKNREVTVLP